MKTTGVMKSMRVLCTLVLAIVTHTAAAKALRVVSFEPQPFDLTASVNPKLDLAGNPCALIKVTCHAGDGALRFEGNLVESSDDGSEVSAYFSAGTKRIVVKVPGYAPLSVRFSDFEIYCLLQKQVYALVIDAEASTQGGTAAQSIFQMLDDSGDDPVEDMVAKANKLFADGNYSDALKLIEKAAGLGHPEAQLSLGLLYEKGISGTPDPVLKKNYKTAFLYVQKSAMQGFAEAQKVLSRYYRVGIGVELDESRANSWSSKYALTQRDQSGHDEQVFVAVEQQPEFPGGDAALLRYISAKIHYPSVSAENGIQGRITVNFVVDKDGTVGDARVLRSSCYYYRTDTDANGRTVSTKVNVDGGDAHLEQEALRVVNSLPKFYPGLMNGVPVKVWYTVPINFRLQ